MEFRAFSIRAWITECRRLLALIIVTIATLTAFLIWLPSFPATIIVLSDAEISDVVLTLEKNPPVYPAGPVGRGRVFAWDTDLAQGAGMLSVAEISWLGLDGHRRHVREELVHIDKLPRCIHILRLDTSAEPIPLWPARGSESPLIHSVCR
jgi:hypothetical protein